MLLPIAYLFCWMIYLIAVGLVLCASILFGVVPSLRALGPALRRGATSSISGLALLHALTFPVAFALTMGLNVAFRLISGGRLDVEPPPWSFLPLLSVLLGLPLVATVFGVYLGFRAGWEVGRGREPADLARTDHVIGRMARIGRYNPVRWYLSDWS